MGVEFRTKEVEGFFCERVRDINYDKDTYFCVLEQEFNGMAIYDALDVEEEVFVENSDSVMTTKSVGGMVCVKYSSHYIEDQADCKLFLTPLD
jgi:hypothetical protein